MKPTTDIIICGAGIAGVAAAYQLAVKHGIGNIKLIDERAPLTLTSDKSTECYRNWWPDNAMVGLMNRSIDIMEELADESGNIFHLNRRGYLYLTADPENISAFEQEAQTPSRLGAGPLRVYCSLAEAATYQPSLPESFDGIPDGGDLFLDRAAIQEHFPYLPNTVVAALHARRAGWFSAQQLGMYMLDQARAHGVEFVKARVTGVDISQGAVSTVHMSDNTKVATRHFVNAAGPFVKEVGAMLGLELPIHTELHLKVALRDRLGVVPRHIPMLIWTDTQTLDWSDEERGFLAEDEDTRWLLEKMPAGAHTRPEGAADSEIILLLWEYKHQVGRTLEVHPTSSKPIIPPPLDEMYPEIALRGMAALLPRFSEYFERMPQPILDGGYYTKTRENRPLIGPLPVDGAYIIGALSGYGLMSACGAGDLLAAQITGGELPSYAPALALARYDDPEYLKLLEDWGNEGQL